MNDNFDSWLLKVINDNHNHDSTLADVYSVQQKLIMNEKICNEIFRQSKIQIRSFQILSSFRMSNFIEKSLQNSINLIIINLIFKSRNIYILKAKWRREALTSLIFIHTLIRELSQKNWTCVMQKNKTNHITNLFYINKLSQIILKTNNEILIMNCIYKINRYKLSLLLISDQIAMHSFF